MVDKPTSKRRCSTELRSRKEFIWTWRDALAKPGWVPWAVRRNASIRTTPTGTDCTNYNELQRTTTKHKLRSTQKPLSFTTHQNVVTARTAGEDSSRFYARQPCAPACPSAAQDWASEQGFAPIGMFNKCFPRHGKPPAKSTVEQLQPPLIVTDSTPKNCRPPCIFFFFFAMNR